MRTRTAGTRTTRTRITTTTCVSHHNYNSNDDRFDIRRRHNTINGFWTAEIDSGNLDFILNFETGTNSNFSELNDNWDVLEATQTIIRLSDVSGGGTDLLTFGREPNGGGGGPDPQELRDILQAGTWYIEKYLEDGDDETSDFADFDFS